MSRAQEPSELDPQVEGLLAEMSPEQRVGQLFFVIAPGEEALADSSMAALVRDLGAGDLNAIARLSLRHEFSPNLVCPCGKPRIEFKPGFHTLSVAGEILRCQMVTALSAHQRQYIHFFGLFVCQRNETIGIAADQKRLLGA